ncbi:MAG: hypothetical protein QOE59_1054, partial [Actinomycetota bacterium]|nr:hypothetical protein [Actinomycetota bacterium]
MSADAAEPIDPAAPRGGAREGGPAARPDAPAVGPTDAERARVLRLVPAGRPTVLNRPPTVPPPPEAMPTPPMPARPPHKTATAPRHVPDDARTAVVPRISAEHRPENHAEVPAAPEVPTVAPEAAG